MKKPAHEVVLEQLEEVLKSKEAKLIEFTKNKDSDARHDMKLRKNGMIEALFHVLAGMIIPPDDKQKIFGDLERIWKRYHDEFDLEYELKRMNE